MSEADETRPKRAKKTPKHECTVILLDVGSNMSVPIPGTGVPAIDYAKEVVDWIFTRKIFTDSPDEFVLVLFGSEETNNPFSKNKHIYFCEDEMQTAKIDWLKLLEKEVKPSKKVEGDFLTALVEAVGFMRSCLEAAPENAITGSNILLVSNLLGNPTGKSERDFKDADAVVNGIKALSTNFNVIGPSLRYWDENEGNEGGEDSAASSAKSFAKADVKLEIGESILSDIVKRCEGVTYSFQEALPMLQHFVPRRVTARGQRFYLELAEDLKLPLLLYKKIQLADMNLKFKKIATTTNAELKRETVYEKISPATAQGGTPEKDEAVEEEDIFLTKEDIVKGYTFGSTIVPFNEADKQEYGWQRETRSMQLMQFVKRSEILQHYLMDGSAYYCLPPADDEDGCTAISALVHALLEEDCVIVSRYVYNAASQPRLLALFPRMSKKGLPMFVAVQLPYYEDFRGLEFPPLDDTEYASKADQKRAMEAFVSSMDLSNSYFDPETGEYGEDLRPRNVPNPKLQRVCEAVKFRALHPGEKLPQFESRIVNELLLPRPQLAKAASEPLSWIEKSFTLHEVKRKRKDSEKSAESYEGDSLPGFGEDESTLPESGHFITAGAVKDEDDAE